MGLSIDREKVIKGLECCTTGEVCISDCPYFKEVPMADGRCITTLQADALALLKEQEAVPPEREYSGGGITWWNVCGACRTAINPNDKYCHECGRKVRWND